MDIVKTCRIHGDLIVEQCLVKTEKRWAKPREYYACKECCRGYSKKFLAKDGNVEKKNLGTKAARLNPEYKAREAIRKKAWVLANRAKVNLAEAKRRARNPEKVRKSLRDLQAKWRRELHDNYVKSQYAKKFGISMKDFPKDLLEPLRALMRLKRLIEERKQECQTKEL